MHRGAFLFYEAVAPLTATQQALPRCLYKGVSHRPQHTKPVCGKIHGLKGGRAWALYPYRVYNRLHAERKSDQGTELFLEARESAQISVAAVRSPESPAP